MNQRASGGSHEQLEISNKQSSKARKEPNIYDYIYCPAAMVAGALSPLHTYDRGWWSRNIISILRKCSRLSRFCFRLLEPFSFSFSFLPSYLSHLFSPIFSRIIYLQIVQHETAYVWQESTAGKKGWRQASLSFVLHRLIPLHPCCIFSDLTHYFPRQVFSFPYCNKYTIMYSRLNRMLDFSNPWRPVPTSEKGMRQRPTLISSILLAGLNFGPGCPKF